MNTVRNRPKVLAIILTSAAKWLRISEKPAGESITVAELQQLRITAIELVEAAVSELEDMAMEETAPAPAFATVEQIEEWKRRARAAFGDESRWPEMAGR